MIHDLPIHIEHLIVFGLVLMPGGLYLFRRHLDKRYLRRLEPKGDKAKGREC